MCKPDSSAMASKVLAPNLDNVAVEWEQEASLRQLARRHKSIVEWHDHDESQQAINIKNASMNFLLLKPLVKRLRLPGGEVSMVTLPALEKQLLDPSVDFAFSLGVGLRSRRQPR